MRQFLLLLSLLIFVGCQTAQNPTSELATQDTEAQTVTEQTEPIATEEVAQSENPDVSVEQKTYDHSKIAVPPLQEAWNKMMLITFRSAAKQCMSQDGNCQNKPLWLN